MINIKIVLSMSIFPKSLINITPTHWIVKEIKFKRKHKMGYIRYGKNKFLKHIDFLKNRLIVHEKANNIGDYPLFIALFAGVILTGGLFILSILVIFLLNFFITITITLTWAHVLFYVGLIPLFYMFAEYLYYFTLSILKYIFRIKKEEL